MNHKASTNIMTENSSAGDMVLLAAKYWFGKGEEKNQAKGLALFHEAAEAGDALAQGILGEIYLLGNATPEDMTKALYWLRKAIAQGEPTALIMVAYLHRIGRGVEKNLKSAFNYYQRIIQKNDDDSESLADAHFGIAEMLAFGEGVERDMKQAIAHLKEADFLGCYNADTFIYALQGSYGDQRALGNYYRHGIENVWYSKNVEKAQFWFLKAADQGDSRSAKALHLMYLESEIKNDDVADVSSKAMFWCAFAALTGDFVCKHKMNYVLANPNITSETRDAIDAANTFLKSIKNKRGAVN